MDKERLDELLTSHEAAAMLRLSQRTLERHRTAGTGAPVHSTWRCGPLSARRPARLDPARRPPEHERAGPMTAVEITGAHRRAVVALPRSIAVVVRRCSGAGAASRSSRTKQTSPPRTTRELSTRAATENGSVSQRKRNRAQSAATDRACSPGHMANRK